jgi:hypothetical protein
MTTLFMSGFKLMPVRKLTIDWKPNELFLDTYAIYRDLTSVQKQTMIDAIASYAQVIKKAKIVRLNKID